MSPTRRGGWSGRSRCGSVLLVVAALLVAAPAAAVTEGPAQDTTSHVRAAFVEAHVDGARVVRIAGAGPDAARVLPDPRLFVDAVDRGDPYRVHQWGLDVIGEEVLLGGERGAGITVAVVDSGVDATHPELAGAVVDGWSVFGTDWGHDSLGHGTAVAGIIAARADDGTGMAGLADAVDIVSVKVVDPDGGAWASDVAEGVLWAVDRGVDVINISLTTDVDAPVLRHAVGIAMAEGVVVVASAGNHGSDGNATMYPAAVEGVVGVAPLEESLAGTTFGSHGDWVDLSAPGTRVFTTAPGRGHTVVTGGSFAAPFVVGALAHLLSVAPHTTAGPLSPDSAIQRLLDSTVDVGRSGWDERTGAGALDLAAALVDLGPRRILRWGRAERAASLAATAIGDGRATSAVLVSDDGWADALSGTGLVGPDVPLLLAGRGGVPAATRRELSRVLPRGSEVVLLGGEQVLPQLVADELEAVGWVPVRVSGPSRIETALAVASRPSLAESDTVLLASADGWVDAVAGGVAAARLDVPLLLTPGDVLHPAVAGHLAALQPTRIVLLGGPAALSKDLEEKVAATTGVTPTRAGGPDRRETAEAIRDLLLDDVAGMTVIAGWDADAWVDGLAAAPIGLPIAIAPESGSATIQSSGVLATRQRVVDAAS